MFNDDRLLDHGRRGVKARALLAGELLAGALLPAAEEDNDAPALMDNWIDSDGYFKVNVGEVLEGRYRVMGTAGRGVFSCVLICEDALSEPEANLRVAIKVLKNNDTMRRAGMKELDLHQVLKQTHGPDSRSHVVRLFRHFEHRAHLCLVFELMHLNLKEVLDKFGKGVGIKLSAVRVYAKQLLVALLQLSRLAIIHADIKPHNILVNDGFTQVKLCDLGSAFRQTDPDNAPTPYLVSRFYRAPEIILGLEHTTALDMWSLGTCLYEAFTGTLMFPGRDNNDMLWLMQELKGPFPKKIIRRHFQACITLEVLQPSFDPNFRFKRDVIDPVSGAQTLKLETVVKPTEDLMAILAENMSPGDDKWSVSQFKDLLERMTCLDPLKRIGIKDALAHPFIAEKTV